MTHKNNHFRLPVVAVFLGFMFRQAFATHIRIPNPNLTSSETPTNPHALTKSDLRDLIQAGDRAASGLSLLKSRIETAHKNYKVAKTVGSGTSIVGALSMIGGVIAAPFTAGLSLGLTVGGIVTIAAGTGTSVTASIIEFKKVEYWAKELNESLRPRKEILTAIGEKVFQSPKLWRLNSAIPTAGFRKIAKFLNITAKDYVISKVDMEAIANISSNAIGNNFRSGIDGTKQTVKGEMIIAAGTAGSVTTSVMATTVSSMGGAILAMPGIAISALRIL